MLEEELKCIRNYKLFTTRVKREIMIINKLNFPE